MGWASGKHALITGGGTGIGAAAARALAAEGATVSLIGRRMEPLEVLANELGGLALSADMTDRAAMEKAFHKARSTNGLFDHVILNAGIGDSAPFLRTGRQAWDKIIATNLTALFDGAQLTLPDLLDNDGKDKRLVIVASVAGLRGGAYAAPYVASKHGAVGLMKSLAIEYAKSQLTINAVCPAFVDTPMVDDSAARIAKKTGRSDQEAIGAIAALNRNGRLIKPEEIGAAIAFLCSPASASTTGSCLTIDGGTTA